MFKITKLVNGRSSRGVSDSVVSKVWLGSRVGRLWRLKGIVGRRSPAVEAVKWVSSFPTHRPCGKQLAMLTPKFTIKCEYLT